MHRWSGRNIRVWRTDFVRRVCMSMWRTTARIWECDSRSTHKSEPPFSPFRRTVVLIIFPSCIHCKTCDIKVPDQDINCKLSTPSSAVMGLSDYVKYDD